MAIIYSYPVSSIPELEDLLIGVERGGAGEGTPRTKTFTIGSIVDLVETYAVPNLQQVVNAGNTIIVPATKQQGVNITLSATPTTYQNGVKITMPQVTGGTAPNSDAFASFLNGQNPATLSNYVSSFYSVVQSGSDNISFISEHATGATSSIHAQYYNAVGTTSDFIIGIKTISSDPYVASIVFKVDSNGNTTANSFVKTNGGATEYLMADGNARVHTITNSTQATNFTLATLNSTYPTATIGYTVQCTNPAVLKAYQKTSTGWISYAITNVI